MNRQRSGRRRAVAEILLWWVLTAAVWLATLSTRAPAELAAMAGGSLPCAVLARSARLANAGHWRFRVRWLRWAGCVARDVPVQTVQAWTYALAAHTARGSGRANTTDVSLPGGEPTPVAAGRRAGAVLAFAATPATVVVDCDPRKRSVLLHRIRRRPAALEAAVQR